jgi:hypothetical protein
MPTRKQRRRQQKLQRHEWEEVYVDDEGNVLPPEEAEQLVAQRPAPKARNARAAQPGPRERRPIEAPSWRRTAKRGLLFFPLMLLTVMLIGGDLTLAQQLTQTVVLMLFFLPFSYFMDTMVWRSYQRRLARTGEKK